MSKLFEENAYLKEFKAKIININIEEKTIELIFENYKSKNQDKKMEKHLKELPFIIGKVVGQIEFAQDRVNKQK